MSKFEGLVRLTLNPSSEQVAEHDTRSRNAFRVSVLILGILGVITPVYLYLAFQTGTWQMFVLVGAIVAMGIVAAAGIILSRRGRPGWAAWLLIGITLAVLLIITPMIAGVGLAFSMVGVFLTVVIAGQTLPNRQAGWAIVVSVVVGFAILLLDQFVTEYQLVVPQLQIVIPTVCLLGAGVFGYFAIRQFRDYTLRTKMVVILVTVAVVAVAGMGFVATWTLRSVLAEQIDPIYTLAANGEEALAPLTQFTHTLQLAAAVILVLAGLGALFVVRFFIEPILALTTAAAAMRAGNLDVEAQVESKDEIGVLANTFNQMAGNLRQRIEAEQEANEKSNQLAEEAEQAREKAVQLAEAERKAKEYLEQTVENYLAFVERVAAGDLTARLLLNGDNDALTILGRNLNTMVESLGEMTAQIREATVNITSAATEILAATTQQASGASEQSAAISQTSTTIDEVKTIVEQAFAKAQSVAEQALQSRNISRNGQEAVTNTVESMNQIKERVEGIAENILALSEQTQQIGDITATVNEIASQSNLLALNASVEAARAGEHGKGFAVVAVEVRNLAEQSKQATAQVKAILNEIQRATNAAVMATEEGTKGVDAGVQLTGQTGETIQQLAASIGESASAAQQIVASVQQQTTGMEQIALAMENINQATTQNMTSVRQAEKSAQDLSSVARQMEALVARYKLN